MSSTAIDFHFDINNNATAMIYIYICKLYTINCTLYSVQFKVCIAYSIIHCILSIGFFTLYILRPSSIYTLYTVHVI